MALLDDDDPEGFFMDQTREVTERYKQDSLTHLKRQFRYLTADIITKVWVGNNGLFLLSVRDLRRVKGKNEKRKTRRGDDECPLPGIKNPLEEGAVDKDSGIQGDVTGSH